jgi:anti-anti-sigma factor
MHDDARVEDSPVEPPVLNVGFASVGSSCVLTLSGELTGSSIPALEAQIDQIGGAACEHVVLDVSGLVAIDSVGLHVLIGLEAYVHGLGARLSVAGAKGQVAEALATTTLDLGDAVWTPVPRRQPLVQSTVLLDEGSHL